ncbi:ABC transporter permease [Lysobacter enzymogenes]|uniref:ABC transporter permease n=1 Tax=Lysobacter enzymogenes TaxID=69 RepID=UPI001A96B8E7|nr:ABC transporter permease [Lysobacter enzymogenes]QQP94136.1 ABC transporter permease [Lysobacter enzymogenes]
MSAVAVNMAAILAEWRQAWRALLRRPGYLAIASLTLALGIAAVVAVFSLFYQGLLRPLPFPDAGRLAAVGMDYGDTVVSAPAMLDSVRAMPGTASAGIASAYLRNVNIVRGDALLVGPVLAADHGFLATLGVKMALGRNFSAEEDRVGGADAVVLSHDFWMRRFGGRSDALGASIVMDGRPASVVGVLPESFAWPQAFDLLVPIRLQSGPQDMDANHYVIARFDDAGAGRDARIDARMHALVEARRATLPADNYDYLARNRYKAMPLRDFYTGGSGSALWLFFAAALCVLAVAAINLANLVMQRSALRSHDSAVRAALGAPALRLAMPALGEGLLIGAVGAAAGLALAWACLRLLKRMAPAQWLPNGDIALIDASWAFALAVGLLLALLASAVGAWRARVGSLTGELVGGGRSGLSRGAGRLARAMVVAQVALAALLLVVSSLFMRSLYELNAVPLGFDGASVQVFALSPVEPLYPDAAAVAAQSRAIMQRLRAVPGVERVAMSTNLPIGSQLNMPATLADGSAVQPQFRPVDGEFFATFAIASVRGRVFDARDDAGAEPVCVVSRSFVDKHLRGDPIGQTLRMGRGADSETLPAMRIVGVVGDVRQFGPDQPAPPILYLPFRQLPPKLWTKIRGYGPLNYAIGARGAGADFEVRVRRAVAEAAPQQPIGEVRRMRAVVEAGLQRSAMQLLLVGLFSAMTLLLAGIGLYAVLSIAVASRRHEYGVRAAMGASPARLVRLVLRDSGAQVALGLALGIGAALAASRLIRRFVFGISTADPLAIALVIGALAAAAALATVWPALRAARSDPMQAFRAQ